MKKLLLCGLIGLESFSCHATSWEYLGGYPDGSLKYYGDIDSKNLKRHTGMIRKVSSYANGKRLSTDYMMLEADCRKQKTRVLSVNGKMVKGVWNEIHPGSLGETEHNWLCSK